MRLKLHYESVDVLSDGTKSGKVSHVEVKNASPRWHVSPRLVERAVTQGWMTVGRSEIRLHTDNGDVVYVIESGPSKEAAYYDCRLEG